MSGVTPLFPPYAFMAWQGQLCNYLYTAYLKILSELQTVLSNVTEIGENYMVVNLGWGGLWKEWVVAWFDVVPWNLPRWIEEDHEH
jgi:hypothetical protein